MPARLPSSRAPSRIASRLKDNMYKWDSSIKNISSWLKTIFLTSNQQTSANWQDLCCYDFLIRQNSSNINYHWNTSNPCKVVLSKFRSKLAEYMTVWVTLCDSIRRSISNLEPAPAIMDKSAYNFWPANPVRSLDSYALYGYVCHSYLLKGY